MQDLIYAGKDIEDIIKAKYPQAKITDASDDIHRERFELELDIEEDEFYPFAFQKGFAPYCFAISLKLESLKFREIKPGQREETLTQLSRWSAPL